MLPSIYKYHNENFFSYLQQIYGKKIVIPNLDTRKYYYINIIRYKKVVAILFVHPFSEHLLQQQKNHPIHHVQGGLELDLIN